MLQERVLQVMISKENDEKLIMLASDKQRNKLTITYIFSMAYILTVAIIWLRRKRTKDDDKIANRETG